ncbi:ABC transporter related protein [[Clostridium] ultunense Esp]|uniref:ABC transporter ATP-binding protein n=1 Tax=Thermicanus aegyptius TaxID=94009 RepID=UPI0002B7032A|nr:ABC transporter ATP-binding protein [Thermicanus aegyptius]CCQ96324.1 ABC transporter related protein [[Clostridium] ultunense Esp]
MEYSLEVKNLSKSFGDFALDGVSFSLPQGYIMGFIGPNGAGKSTTIRILLGLLKRDGGDVKILGQDPILQSEEIKQRIGVVFDENYLYETLTLLDMKRVVAPFYKRWDEARFREYIDRFSLPLHKKIKDLSKGMKMKFALSLALSHHADLLILDEPTSGLDPVVRSEFLDILQELMEDEGKSVFFSTHITSDLERIADYITLIDGGKIRFSMTKDEMMERYSLVKGGRELLTESMKEKLIGFKEHAFGFEGLTERKGELMKEYKEGLVFEKPTLDEIMIYYTRRNPDGTARA